MNSYLLNRALGSIDPRSFQTAQHTRLLHALQPAPDVSFSPASTGEGRRGGGEHGTASDGPTTASLAHATGVNTIAIDKFEGRYLLSGGADSSIAIWDLEAATANEDQALIHRPLGYAS
ncbi:hypothetical protein LTR66_010677, partial [Elasticomyces elasticus]